MRALAVLIALVATASAAPRKKPAKKPAPAPAAPAPAPSPPPEPAPDPTPPPRAAIAPPAAAVRLAMRTAPRPHGGFVDDLDCSACHTSDGWQLAAIARASGFDHDRTGFPLRGAHVATSCGGCHTGQAKPATDCEGCHRDPHEGRQLGTCAECHTAVAWSDTRTLEQHRRTRMPLTGRHATTDCSDCHKRQGERSYSDTPTDCYACHRKDYHAASIHPTHDGSGGGAAFPRDCGLCHQTSSWSPAFVNPATLPRAIARVDHERYFALATGSHRSADCATCHPDTHRPQLARCDGCHADITLRAQHRAPISPVASACLHCHPRGAAR